VQVIREKNRFPAYTELSIPFIGWSREGYWDGDRLLNRQEYIKQRWPELISRKRRSCPAAHDVARTPAAKPKADAGNSGVVAQTIQTQRVGPQTAQEAPGSTLQSFPFPIPTLDDYMSKSRQEKLERAMFKRWLSVSVGK
jgi:hypothetical protein